MNYRIEKLEDGSFLVTYPVYFSGLIPPSEARKSFKNIGELIEDIVNYYNKPKGGK